jgi:hypothetical protein
MHSARSWVLVGIENIGTVVDIIADAIVVGIATLSCTRRDSRPLLALTSTCTKSDEYGAVTETIGNVADGDFDLVGSG